MSVHVTLGLGPGGAVAIKTATGAESIERLRGEAARLRLAGHPGVVTVVSCGPVGEAVELHTRFAGDPVSRWSGSLAGTAGLCAAIAATLADLHDVGLVHGRLDASHVLVGADGRPRLCGLSDPGEGEPADDVHALGVLVDDLLARVETRRGALAWPRTAGSGGDRRALSQAAARALDPVAARRPSARVLARSILAAVPGAELPPPSAPPSVSGGADGLGPWLTPTDDWPPAVVRQLTPASAGSSIHTDAPDSSGSGTPAAEVGVPAAAESHAAVGADNEVGASGGVADADAPPDPAHGDVASESAGGGDRPAGDDLDALWWLDDDTHDQPQVTEPVSAVTGPSPLPRLGETRFRSGVPDEPGRPPRPAGRRRRPRRGRATALGIGSACVVGLTLVAGGAVATRANTNDREAGPQPIGRAGPGECPSTPVPLADVDGDGCAESVRVDGRIVQAGTARWSLGEPGDVAAVGDWDCDGSASPALLRPATGDVFVFTRWAVDGEAVTVDAVESVGGGTAVRAAPGTAGCDALVVERASGDVVVEVDR
jgi:hypothetical protein